MIGDGQGGLLQLLRALDQVVDPIGAVEEGELGVAVQVDEGHREEDSDTGSRGQRKRPGESVV